MSMSKKVYQVIASAVVARQNCERSGNAEWEVKHTDTIRTLTENHMPHGSGVDNGCTLDLDRSTGERLVFATAYHHMTESGCYDGWTEHSVIVRASLCYGFTVTITGRNRNDVKDYLAELFQCCLDAEVPSC